MSPQMLRVRCTACHSDKFDSTAHGPHAVLNTPEWQAAYDLRFVCLGCHRDAEGHVASGGEAAVFAFDTESPTAKSDACNGCHRATHPEFDSSPHARAGIACTDCHSQHTSPQATDRLLRVPQQVAGLDTLGMPSALCRSCHEDIAAAFELNERHRLIEGSLDCTSCHDPHAPATRTLLGGFGQQVCAGCHEDKSGPFVFEHPASRVEGCTECHSPHGSTNRHLLATQRVAELCIGCHAEIPQFHLGFSPAGPSRFSLDTQCTNCHSQIHGSNFDPHFLR